MREILLFFFWIGAGVFAGKPVAEMIFAADLSLRDRCEIGLWFGVLLGAAAVCP